MSLGINQFLSSPNKEKKISLLSQLKGDESSEDNCCEEDKINIRKISLQNKNFVNYKTENDNKINEKTYFKTQSKNLNQSKNSNKQKNYEYNFSSQVIEDTNFKQENMSKNLNYSLNNQLVNHKNKSSQQQNEIAKGTRAFMNYEDYSDQSNFKEDTSVSNDNYIKNDLKQFKETIDKDELNNGTSSSALIKKGNLFKNIDYFNKTNCSFSDYDKELYNNRKVERRKIRKSSIQNFNDLIESENNFTSNQDSSYLEKKNEIQNKESFNKYNQLMNEKQFNENLDNYQNRTRFVNKKRNYHHYIHKDSNSKRASISSAEISKYDTFSSSSSASPTQDQKIDINELNCSKNNYVGYNIDDVINIDNINKKKNTVQKNIFYSSNNSLIDETINENNKSQKNPSLKVSKLNDLIRCDNDILSNYNLNSINGELDLIGNSEFSSSFMHKSASTNKITKNNSTESKYDNQKNKNFELADLCQDTLKEFSNVDNFYNIKNNIEIRDYQSSPELLKFNDIETNDNSKENKNLSLPQNNNENFYENDQNYSKIKEKNLQKLSFTDKNNKNLIDELENEFINIISEPTISSNNQIFDNKSESLINDLDNKNESFENESDTKDSEIDVCISKSSFKKENKNKDKNDTEISMSYSNELKKSFQMNCDSLDLDMKDSFNDYFNKNNQELPSPVRSLPKTPGYTQRVLNHSNKDQIKYDLFQLGTPNNNNVNNCLIDIDRNEEIDNSEELNVSFLEQQALDENKKNVSHSLNNLKDISRDELVKSILNIPYSNYDCLDQNEEADSQNYVNQTKKISNQTKTVFDSLEKLNICDNNIKTSNITNKNDIKINSNFISGYDKSKDNNSSIENIAVVNKSIKNRINSSDSKKSRNSCSLINNLDNFNNLISSENSKMKETSVSENNEMNDCLDLNIDNIEIKNSNFDSTNVKNLTNEKTKKSIKTNGLISNLNEDEISSDNFEKSNNVKTNKNEKDLDKNEYLIDTENFDLINEQSKITDKNYKKQFSSQPKKDQLFGHHQIKSKILQDTVTNHLLNESLIDVNDNNLFEAENIFDTTKKSPKKQKNNFNENNFLDSSKQVDKHYSHNLLNSKFNLQNKNNEETLRNFSLSPETTDCESVEVESEFSMSSFMSIPGLNQMPILEDGLSSGSASDNEVSQNFKIDNEHIFKKPNQQQTEQSVESPKSELFAKCRPRNKKNEQRHSDYDLSLEKDLKYYNNYDKCDNLNSSLKHNLCNEQINNDNNRQQVMKKSRSLFNSNSNSMNASLNNGLLTDSSEPEHSTHPNSNEISSKQLWNSKLQQQLHQPQQQQNRGHYNQSNIGCENQNGESDTGNSLLKLNDDKPKLIEKTFHEDDCDTDQETDRLLGAQRSEDRTFYEEKNPPIKKKSNSKEGSKNRPNLPRSVLIEGVLFRARYLGSTQLICEGQPTKATRMMQAEEAVSRIKAPEGETQPSTEVDLFISTEKIMVLNTDLKEIMMDHTLRTISYIADIGDLLVLMARRRQQIIPSNNDLQNNVLGVDKIKRTTPKMICHVFESEEAQFIAQSIGQAFQVAYMEFLKANGIEDSSFVKEMDYQEVLNSQEIFGNELEMFARKEKQKEVIVPKKKGEILGMVIVESGWGSMLPTVVIANMAQQMPASRCGALNIGDQIIAINGISLVGLPLAACQQYIKNTKIQTVVKLTVVPCAPVVEVKIKRPDTKYQLGFSVQNGVICSLLRGGIAERGGVRVGHRIIEINGQSVVAVPHEKIVNLLATSVGEIHMKTMPTSMFRLLTGQETPMFI